MSKFIIGLRNSEPAPPEVEYVCGPKSPITDFSACVALKEVLWDENPDTAKVFHSFESLADAIVLLTDAGCDASLLCVMQKITTYQPMDAKTISTAVRENRIQHIINNIPTEDLEYLRDAGVLDLTNVT